MSVNARSRALQICMLFFFLLSMASCEPSKELSGTYVANYDVAKEKLVLNKDGTYTQEVTLNSNSKVDVSRGTWTYSPEDQYVSFANNFMLVINGFGELNPEYAHRKIGIVSLPAHRYFGRMRIGSSTRVVYKKID